MSKESFKEFVRSKPELYDYVDDKSMTWQKFYELYDIFGPDDEIWTKYSKKNKINISKMMDNIDVDNIQKYLENAQKALDFFSELSTKTSDTLNEVKPTEMKPIDKIF